MSIIMAITHLTTQLLSERTQSFASSSEILTFFFSSCHAVGDRDTLRHSQQVNYWAYCSTAEGKLFILFFFELHIF